MPENERSLLPVRAALRPEGLYLALRDIAPAELRDAFMQETVLRVPAQDQVVHIAREDVGKAASGTAPAGIVFHVARCGSTLIAQLLKQLGDLVVYAEPLPVNEILVPPHPWPRHELVGALRSLGDALARHARKPYVLKLSSWNTLLCDIVAEAYPDTPWVLSLRDPVEVGVSLLQQTPGWMRADAEPYKALARYIAPEGAPQSQEEFVARLYGAFCASAGRLGARRGKLVDYAALPDAVWEIVAPHFAQAVDDTQRERMRRAALLNSKAPVGQTTAHASDAATKQSTASAALRRACEAFASPRLAWLRGLHEA